MGTAASAVRRAQLDIARVRFTMRIMTDPFIIAGRSFHSRLIVGTGKYKSFQETARALEASGAEMVTVAVRRVNLDRSKESDATPPDSSRANPIIAIPLAPGWRAVSG